MRKIEQNLAMNSNQEGIVAIVVTVLVMIVLSLTTLGFARLAQREQRQTLDSILGSQAFYAAESGVNDAIDAINTTGNLYNDINNDKTQCDAPAPDPLPDNTTVAIADLNSLINSELGNIGAASKYTCLLIDQAPEELSYSSVSENKSSFADINATAMTHLVIGWEDEAGAGFHDTTNPGATPLLPNATTWGASTTVLRVDVTDLSSGNYSRDVLYANTMTFFLYPWQGTTSNPGLGTAFSAANSGAIIPVECSDSPDLTQDTQMKKCNFRLNIASSHVFVRARSVYRSSSMKIKAFDASGPLRIRGTQVVIDSTGKSSDVLKRMKVNINKRPEFDYPENAIETVDSICKLLEFSGPLLTPGVGNGNTDPACQPSP
jgi:hypothetical protein